MARGRGSPSGGPLGKSYGEQLTWLKREVEAVRKRGGTGADVLMLLSLAQSVKVAKDHSFNCPLVKPFDTPVGKWEDPYRV